MTQHYDAIVVGLGTMGSAALARLALRGRRVLGLEQFYPAHSHGSSHGGGRVFRTAYFEDSRYVPVLLRAGELWEDLERRTSRTILIRSGAVVVGRPGGDSEVDRSIASARQYGIPHEVLDSAELRRRWPVFRPRPDEIAVYEPGGGVLLAEEAVLAHQEVAIMAGAQALFGTKVLRWADLPGGCVSVLTTSGEFTADRLVLTAGPWFGKLVPETDPFLAPERVVYHRFKPVGSEAALSPESLPAYIVKRPDTGNFYGFPSLPGIGVKIGLGYDGRSADPDKIDRNVYPDEAEEARRQLADWMPEAAGECLGSKVCMVTPTPDRHFILGIHPQHPQVILGALCAGHGFKFSSAMGEVLADLTIDGSTRQPLGHCAPTRFGAEQFEKAPA